MARQITLYSYNELPPEAAEKARESARELVYELLMENYSPDFKNSLEAFAELFNIKLDFYDVDEYNYSYGMSIKSVTVGYNELTGEELYLDEAPVEIIFRYLNNNVLPRLITRKKYHKIEWDEVNKRLKPMPTRVSNILYDTDDMCKLTGCYNDISLLDNVFDFIKNWKRSKYADMTYTKLMESCLNKFFEEWKKCFRYATTNDAAHEVLSEEYVDVEFTEDGHIITIEVSK